MNGAISLLALLAQTPVLTVLAMLARRMINTLLEAMLDPWTGKAWEIDASERARVALYVRRIESLVTLLLWYHARHHAGLRVELRRAHIADFAAPGPPPRNLPTAQHLFERLVALSRLLARREAITRQRARRFLSESHGFLAPGLEAECDLKPVIAGDASLRFGAPALARLRLTPAIRAGPATSATLPKPAFHRP
jgi:hypothetical protein